MNAFPGPMQAWPSLAEFGQQIRLARSGINLFLYDSGPSAKPTMILFHGLGDDADSWRHVFVPLTEKFRVIALDFPGFGRSDKSRRKYSFALLRDTVLELMDQLALPTVVLMGNSLGAMLAELVAIERPEKVSTLILLDGSLTTRLLSYHKALIKMALPILGPRIYAKLHGQPEVAYQNLRLFFVNLDDLPEADRRFLYERVNQRVGDDNQRYAYFSILRQLIWCIPFRRRHFMSRLIRLGIPTLLIWGQQDAVNSIETAKALVAALPAVQLKVIPEVGHLPQQEAPHAFLSVLHETANG